ncbi:pyrroloquinoline quinone biosynthesis peptide chaperone PqqD [Streptomyces sp. G44]|uniref:pyrroloquinoline quinone biosynthesis peptide chaperone PqqD n=1 Tax=Streptomyces sp. G44 TaxID=2807632 RepID=UPI001EF85F1E|nr:pyrroloquinoline quinone biosynthesis peptide chaperone PqqD [Streptomyces sp. G44]
MTAPDTVREDVRRAWRPVLVRSVLLRHDRVRGVDLLVLPERVVVLRGAAGEIVALCDGERDVPAIVTELAHRHPDAPVAEEVPPFLARLRAEGWLR